MKKLIGLVLVAASLFLVACNGGSHQDSPAPSPVAAAVKPYNIILVSFDAMRAQDMSLYGYARDTTPNLKKFAENAVVFRNATSPASWTLPATMSIFTAVYPSVHGVVNKLVLTGGKEPEPSKLKASVKTLPEQMAAYGYVLGGFTGDAGVTGSFGYSRGFETYIDDRKFGGFDHSMPLAQEFLRTHKDKRFFMFLHGYDVHGQYDPPQGYSRMYCQDYHGKLHGGKKEQADLRERGLKNKFAAGSDGEPHLSSKDMSAADASFYQALYDEKIHLADEKFGYFLKQLDDLGLSDKTVLVVLADHGDEFMEHGNIDHGPTLYQEMLHVPLLVRFPGMKPQVIDERVSTMDALPTVFDFLGMRVPDKLDGISLLPLLSGGHLDPRVIGSETDYRLYSHKRCILKGDYKLIYSLDSHRLELYNLRLDPGEKKELSKAEPQTLADMRKELVRWTDTLPSNYPDYSTDPYDTIKYY